VNESHAGIRLILAFLVSTLLHVLVLYTPLEEQLPEQRPLPPLTARLVPLPQLSNAKQDSPASADSTISADPAAPVNTKESPLQPLAKSDAATEPAELPRHIQLRYDIYAGSDRLKSGTIRCSLDINQGRYVARFARSKSGVSRLLDSNLTILTSQGKIIESGLQPEHYESDVRLGGKKVVQHARFDQTIQTLQLFDGSQTQLPPGTQDEVSFLYQLSLVPVHGELFSMPVSNGVQLRNYRMEIGRRETVGTPMGTLETLILREIHDRHEAHFEVWLGLEFRHLPVRLARFDETGNITESWVVSSIRASDD
jgi:hypothetical protein